jgi:DNA-directed RNA polymerase specialized sigma24 family protein
VSKSWTQSPEAFRRFLSWLDDGVDSNGERYVEMRRRLVSYFARKQCPAADDLADETLSRVARKLDEHGTITDTPPARYVYVVARFVFLESLRAAERRQTSLSAADGGDPALDPPSRPSPDDEDEDNALDRLDRCLAQLAASDRTLILEYYAGTNEERIARRRALAARLQLTPNALSIRACRIRDALEACVSATGEHR